MAQISFAVKANVLMPMSNASWKGVSQALTEAYENKGANKIGYNIGISSRLGFPGSVYIMPELYYSYFLNEVKENHSQTLLKAKTHRLDLPVLLGVDVLSEYFSVFAGPVASYQLNNGESYQTFKENVGNQFKVGYQFGAQTQLGNFIINAKYEGAFSKDQREYINNVTGASTNSVRYDNRTSLFILGVGYKF